MRFFHSIWQDGSASSSRHIYPSEEQYLYPLKCIMSGDNEIILQSEIKLRSMLFQPYPGNQQAGSQKMPFCSMFVMLLSRYFLLIIYRPHTALSFNYNHLDIYFSNQLKSFMWHNIFHWYYGMSETLYFPESRFTQANHTTCTPILCHC